MSNTKTFPEADRATTADKENIVEENHVVIVIEGRTTIQAIDGEYDLADALSLAHELSEARPGQTAGYRRAEVRHPSTERAWQIVEVPYA